MAVRYEEDHQELPLLGGSLAAATAGQPYR